ncbi:MAG: DNA polymerase III subunit beta [Deferribacteres bacterium]|nr:DNA polymerase III subunit beta [candidate division KSB1 bacterium]MCB9509576.1 DNA polymerase III subunit beta [Deferribacteres bacterium]
MKFSVNKADLFASLQKIIGVIPTKTTIPILSNILLTLEDSKLKLAATDLEISMDTACDVSDAEKGALTIPARKFFEIIRELPDLPVTVETDERNHVKVKTEKGVYKLIGESEDEFPRIDVEDADFEFYLSSEKLNRMIDKTIFAVSTDELRTTLMGVYMQILANELRMIATDGHRLAKITHTAFPGDEKTGSVVLPTKALQLVQRNIDDEERIKVSVGDNHVTFTCGDTKIYSKLIEGQFPNYERVIPLDNQLKMYVNKDLLISAVRRVSIFSNQYTHQIKFALSPSSLMIQAEDVEVGGEAQESLPVDYTGDKLEIGYNAAYLLDILRHLEYEEILFNLKDATSAAVITPSEQDADEDLLMLLMPIRLNDSI